MIYYVENIRVNVLFNQMDFMSILEDKDKYGYTSLHYAAKQVNMILFFNPLSLIRGNWLKSENCNASFNQFSNKTN